MSRARRPGLMLVRISETHFCCRPPPSSNNNALCPSASAAPPQCAQARGVMISRSHTITSNIAATSPPFAILQYFTFSLILKRKICQRLSRNNETFSCLMGNLNPLQQQLKKHYTFCLSDQSQVPRGTCHSETVT